MPTRHSPMLEGSGELHPSHGEQACCNIPSWGALCSPGTLYWPSWGSCPPRSTWRDKQIFLIIIIEDELTVTELHLGLLCYMQPQLRRKDIMGGKTNEIWKPKKYLNSAKIHFGIELICFLVRRGRNGRCFIVNMSWWWQIKFFFIYCLRPHSWIFSSFFFLLLHFQSLSLEILIIAMFSFSMNKLWFYL